MATTTTGSVRRALLIGINKYAVKPLDGCVADAELMASILQDRFGFEAGNVTLLRDGEATRPAIFAALSAMTKATKEGDIAFVFYAGHGALGPSPEGDFSESSRSDSTLCLSEAPDRVDIYDDEFGKRMRALQGRTRHTIAVLDCCHSATMMRDGSGGTSRFTDRVPPGAQVPRDFGEFADEDSGARGAEPARYLLITGSRDDEESKEWQDPDDPKVVHGALTRALSTELLQLVPGTTWRDVMQRVAASVTAANPGQHPQVEGDQDLVVFGLEELPQVPSVPVLERTIRQVRLGGGTIHGITVGSRHRIIAQGTKVGDDASFGTVEVTRVYGTTATARILSESGPDAIAAGMRAATLAATTVADVLALENTDPKSRMQQGLTLQLLRGDAEGKTFTVATPDATLGMPVFETGDLFSFLVTSTLDDEVFVNLFGFSPDGTIGRVTEGSANRLGRRTTWNLSEAHLVGEVDWDGSDAVQSFKLFASKDQVDLSSLTQVGSATRGEPVTSRLAQGDWAAVTVQMHVRPRQTLDGAKPAQVAGALVTARGMKGTVRSASAAAPALAEKLGPDSSLTRALEQHGAVMQQSFVLTNATATPSASRSGDTAPPQLAVQVPDAGEEFAQVAMVTDESGLVSWRFATEVDAPPAVRGDGPPPTLRTRTFTFEPPAAATPKGGAGERGLLLELGQQLISIYAFPIGKFLIGRAASSIGEHIELEKTPYRVRTFLPDDYTTDDAKALDAADWQALGRGRALLMIHGTNSRTHTAFGDLPRAFVEAMHARYEGRVFAFDHPTLTHSPRMNIQQLLAMMPDGQQLDIDIICHSRGGLVSRVLAERQDALEAELGSRSIRVGKIVFVGSPNAGTAMADEEFIGDFLDTVTNILRYVPSNGVTDALGLVVTGVKLVAQGLWSGLIGLRSMQPGGDFGTWLAEGTTQSTTTYYALASDFSAVRGTMLGAVAEKLAGKVFKGARNDLVVPTDGVYAANGSRYFPISGQVVFSDEDGVPHTGFFSYPRTTKQIETWLA